MNQGLYRTSFTNPITTRNPSKATARSRLKPRAIREKAKPADAEHVDVNKNANDKESAEHEKVQSQRMLVLPGGYKLSRRDALKLLPAAGGFAATYSLIQNWKAFSYVSPNALLKAAFPEAQPPEQSDAGVDDRIAAFKRFIADKEQRGSMQMVPDFPSGASWFNSSPLSLQRELRGRIVVADFWTLACVNCLHILPGLAALEQRYASQPVTVVGVHSAKFDNEKDDDSIRNAVIRYDVRHPCVNDRQMFLWRELGISSWPTLAIISPAGKLIATLPGEGQEENVDAFIQAALSFYGEKKMLEDKTLPIALEKDKDARLLNSPLRYPGKLAVDLDGNRLFISDSNNHRIVVTDLDGNFVDEIGGNGPLLKDGSFEDASFYRPQGIVHSSRQNILFVADTENHALRQVDFDKRTVTTLAGNGAKGSDYRGGKKGRNQQLNSPWDLTLDPKEEVLYIALAGQHQIWTHYLSTGTTKCFSGNGSERNANGNSAQSTSWAQPSGLSMMPDGQEVIVADSESSCIRAVSTKTGGSRGLVGGDPTFADNLFRFGDKDGRGTEALLQHPLAVCAVNSSSVLVADTYNHRVKVLDLQRGRISSVAGAGTAGFSDGKSLDGKFSEPSGLARGLGNVVYVADTNNHLIRLLQLDNGTVTTLDLKNVPAPRVSPDAEKEAPSELAPGADIVVADPIQAGVGMLRFKIHLPEGYHLTKGANSSFTISSSQPGAISFQEPSGLLAGSDAPEAKVHFRRSAEADAVLRAKVFYCVDGGACLFREIAFQLNFESVPKGTADVTVMHEVSL